MLDPNISERKFFVQTFVTFNWERGTILQLLILWANFFSSYLLWANSSAYTFSRRIISALDQLEKLT